MMLDEFFIEWRIRNSLICSNFEVKGSMRLHAMNRILRNTLAILRRVTVPALTVVKLITGDTLRSLN